MNSKGFTLIELTAVVLVLVLIFLVSFPNLTNIAKQDEEKQYNDMIETLCMAGKTYIYSNMDNYPELSTVDSIINISILDLITNKVLDKDMTNPKTGNEVSKDLLQYKVLSDNSLDCEYIGK